MALPHPLATNTRRLTRVLEQIAAGNRRTRGLAEALDLEPRVIHAYIDAAVWLGFVDDEDEPALTKAGLAYVYAGPRRLQAWSDTASAHPLLRKLSPDGAPPTLAAVTQWVRAESPAFDPAEARRRATVILRLLGPAWRVRRASAADRQLGFAFATSAATRRATLDLRAGTDDSPDVYAVVLRALLDTGELTPSHVRGVLDAAGGDSCGIGGAMAMAVRRGDARRVGETLVVTAGAIERKALAESAVAVALSDPDFRRHLDELFAGRPGDPRRFRPWMLRLFGAVADLGALRAALDTALFGRSLARFPVAGDPGPALPTERAPFLSVATRRDIVITVPESLRELSGGVAAVNRALRGGAAARVPTVLERRQQVHGGLLHPGEGTPRTVADMVALRARVLMNVPAFAFLCALGALDRRGGLRMRVSGADVLVETHPAAGGRAGAMRAEALLDALATARGWWVARAPGGLGWADLVDVGVELGLLARASGFVVLDEALFRRMQTDPEHRDLWEGLLPLADLLEARANRLAAG